MSVQNIERKIIGFVFAIVSIIVLFFMAVNIKNKSNQNIAEITDPEILRAISYGEITDADKKVDGCDYVEFSAFFTRDLNGDGYAEKVKGSCREISGTDTMYAELNVLTQGSLRDAKITVNGENFVWQTAIVEDQIVKGDYIGETSEITLQPILNPGSQKLLWGTIKSNVGDNVNNYTRINSVTLTGKYYDEDGNFVCDINQTRNVTVDWHGETKTEVNKYYYSQTNCSSYENQMIDIATAIKENSIDLTFKVAISETNKELLLQEQTAEITIPKLNGYDATEVTVAEGNVSSNYESGILTITRLAEPDENGYITKSISRSNLYSVTVKYPLEAYDQMTADSIVLNIPIKGKTKGYNNQNPEFQNPHISTAEGILTATYSKPAGDIWNIYAYVGNNEKVSGTNTYRYEVSKEAPTDIYNGNIYKDKTTTYTVRWDVVVGDYTAIGKIELREQKENDVNKSDEFLNTSNTYSSMKNYETTTGIYFSDAQSVLGNDGWIRLYNIENGEEEASLLETFNKDNWDTYTKDNPYAVNTKSIKIETSKPISNSILSVYQIKEMDDVKIAEDFSQSDFESLSYVYTYLNGKIEAPDGVTYDDGETISEINKAGYAYYDAPYSVAKLEINPSQITNQKTENVEFKITTASENSLEMPWINGAFVIELPDNVINANILDVTVSDEDIQILSSDVVEQNGKYLIKVYTNNENEKLYTISVNVALAGNPLNPTEVKNVKLYAYNENCNNYYKKEQDKYDLDADGNYKNSIGYEVTNMTFIAPSGLLTTEYVTDYDDENNTTIAPNIADIEKSDETRTANINVSITNGYSGTISDIVILGKIPFEENTYVLNGADLNSKFTANITGEINVPEKLKECAKIYYSTKENVNKDIADTENDWKQGDEVADWSQIKSYLIDLNGYTLAKEQSEVFTYEVTVPAGLGYNSASFSSHAVYYNLDTENGKLAVQTEPNKVGIQVVAKYSLQLTKNKKAHDNILVSGATYSVTTKDVDGNDITKSATTNAEGILTLRGLYVDREYTLKEISAPKDYAVSTDEIVFEGVIGSDGNLGFNIKQGKFKDNNAVEITIDEKQNYLVKADIEDEAKYTLKINKTDEEGTPIKGVKFILKGREKVANVYKTDDNGVVIISGLCPEAEYELQEIKADGYYIDEEPRRFKIIRNEDGILKVQTNDSKLVNEIKDENITESNTSINAEVVANIVNEKIPTYNLQIIKTGENDSGNIVPLRDAVFKLVNEDTGEQKEYTTNENGIIDIPDLCAYVDGKYITGNYTLQETKAPSNYANNAEQIKFKVTNNSGNLGYSIQNENNLTTLKQCQIDGNTLKLTIQDEPIFKLIKEDSETGERLKNAKFVIIELDENYNEIDYAKDVNGYYVGQKNEKNEYIVTTDENGLIILPLKNGLYKIKEVGYPENYTEGDTYEIVRIGEESEESNTENDNDNAVLKINSIEQLNAFLSSSNSYYGKTVVLMRTLDFKDPNSYESGVVNTSSIQGRSSEFSGTFDGQGYEIRNIKLQRSGTTLMGSLGLFQRTKNATIKNLGVTGSVSYTGATGSTGCLVGEAIYNLTIDNCFFEGDIQSTSTNQYASTNAFNSHSVGGLVGIIADYIIRETGVSLVNITNSHFAGKIEARYAHTTSVGGIIGKQEFKNTNSMTTISNCFNHGDIYGTVNGGNGDSSTYVCAGGIIGSTNNATIRNTYNTGNINAKNNAGGIVGACGGYAHNTNMLEIKNSYNIGTIKGNSNGDGILGSKNEKKIDIGNCYYLNNTPKGTYGTQLTEADMISRSFYDTLNENEVWSYRINDYPIFPNEIKAKIIYATEVTMKNTIKKYNITTRYNGGGSVSGAFSNSYEMVKAGESNQKEIIAKPLDGYTITKITINGKEIGYEVDDDGIYTIPPEYFKNIQEDIVVVVTFSLKNRTLIINKEDNKTGQRLEGAKFKIEQIEDRPEITNEVGEITQNGTTYGFYTDNGKYVSNNQSRNNTVANSYIPIDLRQTKGKYTLKVNAEISSQANYDYGYATVTTSTTAPEYNSYSGRFIYISGTQAARDYTTTLYGGDMYYLHLGYYKNASVSTGTDTFTINNIELSLYTRDFSKGEFETNKYGQIKAVVNGNSRYKITEIKAPEGYDLNSEEVIFDVKDNQDNTVTIYNKHKSQVLVHHYLKDNTKEGDERYTNINVADDEFSEGDIGQEYTTSPRFDLDNLYIEKSDDGKYVVPDNASGTYGEDLIEVNYYYELKPINLKINHYLEGTTTPLTEEKTEEFDSEITFNDDGTYKITTEGSYVINTNEDYHNLLADKYDLVRIESTVAPELGSGDTLTFNENAELTYYYKLKEHKITTEVKEHIESRTNSVTNEKEDTLVKGGKISGEDDSPYEVVSHEENSKNEITATPDAGYRITKIVLESGNGDNKTTTVIYDEENEGGEPASEIKYIKNSDGSITLKALDDTTNDLFTNVTEDKHIIVKFAPEQAKLVIHHYLEGTGEEFGKDPVRVLTTDGITEHEDEVRYDFVDEPYATKPSDNVNKRYKYVSSSTNTSGKYTDETTHVYYYYNLDDFAYSIHYFYDGVEKEENMVQGDKVLFGSEITEYPDKPEGYIFNKVEPTDTEDERKTKLTITENEEENVINVYYVSYCEITTEVIEHEEKYSDGTIEHVKGGTISGEDETPYEEVQKYHDSTKDIVITPDDGYEIARVTIKDLQSETETELNIDSFKAEDGSITLNNENGYFGNMTSNKHVEVEFRKKTKVVVKYLSVDETDDNGNPLVLAEEVVIEGK